MKDTTGHTLPNIQKSAQAWHDSRRQISTAHDTHTAKAHNQLHAIQALASHLFDKSRTDKLTNPTLDVPFTDKELASILKTLPAGKSPGIDAITFEMIKITHSALGNSLLQIFNFLWGHEITPTTWDTAVIHMLYKQGDPQIPENYRAIVLISALKKVYEGLINNRLLEYIQHNECLHLNQFGFMPGRRITEAIYFLTQAILANQKELNRPSYVAFIDFKTAFPNTCRPALWKTLFEAGIQGKLWRNIQSLYTRTKGRVLHPKIPAKDTYDINIGLLEGSKLSPVLFSFLINSLLQHLQTTFPHLEIRLASSHNLDEPWTGAVLFADDLALLAHTPEDLQALLTATQQWAEQHFAVINTDKTVTMSFFEEKDKAELRHTTSTPFHIQHTHKLDTPISILHRRIG
jgi:hypothetical protein